MKTFYKIYDVLLIISNSIFALLVINIQTDILLCRNLQYVANVGSKTGNISIFIKFLRYPYVLDVKLLQ